MTRNTDDLFIELCEVAKRAYSGDMEAAGELRRIGELLALTGGFEAMAHAQGLIHDFEIDHRPAPYSLAGTMGSYWEHISVWAKA